MSESDKAQHQGETSGARHLAKVDACEELLNRLKSNPTDLALRENTARACADVGRHAESAALLRDHFIHLNAHDWGELPCLCKRCLVEDATTANVEHTTFVREFAVASGRILYFWSPLDLETERRQVIASVASKLRQRLSKTKQPGAKS